MASLPDSARAVLQSPALAHLVTLNPDGSPQVTVVWVGLDCDEIVAAHLPEHRKVRNIRNDSRVALSVETQARSGSPGESHPEAPTEPCLTVSRYTALLILSFRTWIPRPSDQTGRALDR